MKKFLLFSACWLLTFGAVQAQKHDVHDSIMLAKFLQQEAYHVDENACNDKILFNPYNQNWKTDPEWINTIPSYVVEWMPGKDGQRIKSINLSGAPTAGGALLSGTFDFSGCDSLVSVQCPYQKLTAVNLSKCKKLITVDLRNNGLSTANFIECPKLHSLDVSENELLFSMLQLESRPPYFGFSSQHLTSSAYTVKSINDEIYFALDLSAERNNNLGVEVKFDWLGINPNFRQGSVFYFKLDHVRNPGPGNDGIICHMKDTIFTNIDVMCSFDIINNMGQLSITTEPLTSGQATAYLYLKQGNDLVLIETTNNLGGGIYTDPLPGGEYMIGIDAPGYLFSYYSVGSTELVADWRRAVPYLVSSGNNDLFVKLSEQKASSVDDNVTISGFVQESTSAGGASRKPTARPFRNATVLLHSPTNLKATVPVGWYLVRTVKPDEETGAYEFKNLPAGIYHVSVDIPGYQSNGESIEVATVAGETYTYKNFIVNEAAKTVIADDVTYTPLVGDVKLVVYPNPVTDVLRVSGLEGSYTVKILDVLGRVVASGKATTPELELSLAGKPSGMYMVRIESQGKSVTRKVIKK